MCRESDVGTYYKKSCYVDCMDLRPLMRKNFFFVGPNNRKNIPSKINLKLRGKKTTFCYILYSKFFSIDQQIIKYGWNKHHKRPHYQIINPDLYTNDPVLVTFKYRGSGPFQEHTWILKSNFDNNLKLIISFFDNVED